MSRTPSPIPSKQLNLALPRSVFTKLSLHLFSELEQRVPYGAYGRFMTERLQEFFAGDSLDLAPYCGSTPNALIVRGTPEAIEQVRRLLEETHE